MNYKIFYDYIKNEYDIMYLDKEEDIDKFELEEYNNLFIEVNKEKCKFNIYVEFIHPLYVTEEYEHEGEVEVY
ncbi:hypothetical protein [Clostridium butyricum]|uniref:hypothetical protein n=1 Tax=Clostridium butyricum TaxID=1492 RepID=UPI0032C18A30